MEKKTIGIAITGSFCTFDKNDRCYQNTDRIGNESNFLIFFRKVQHMDTRFGKAEDFRKKIL